MAAALEEFRPEMILISAGFDAHREDLLGGMALVEADYAWMTRELMALASRHSQKRIVSMLEGGYNLSALGRSAGGACEDTGRTLTADGIGLFVDTTTVDSERPAERWGSSCGRVRSLAGAFLRAAWTPTPVAQPRLIKFNHALAAELGLDLSSLDAAALAEIFSGNVLLQGADPIAMAYAGHQFGQFVPQLGDGRAILLGEVRDRGGVRREIQLKGSGRTPFSRGGDGRAAVGPVLREYLVSEAMHALGIPSTRALAAVATGEPCSANEVFPERF